MLCLSHLKVRGVFWGAVSDQMSTWMLASAQACALKLIFHKSMWLWNSFSINVCAGKTWSWEGLWELWAEREGIQFEIQTDSSKILFSSLTCNNLYWDQLYIQVWFRAKALQLCFPLLLTGIDSGVIWRCRSLRVSPGSNSCMQNLEFVELIGKKNEPTWCSPVNSFFYTMKNNFRRPV